MKEEIEKYIMYGIIILLVGVLGYTFIGGASDGTPTVRAETTNEPIPPSLAKTTGTTDDGDVSIELTPHEVEAGQLEVDIAVNTHSVDLSQFDLKEVTTLEYGGRQVKPVTAPKLSGHHNSGVLKFDVGELPEEFTITITGIPSVEVRVFRWG